MSETPSKRRRAGREAFDPDADPMDVHPYKEGSFWDAVLRIDWLDGWEEARVAWEEEEHKEREDLGHSLQIDCPACGHRIHFIRGG